MLLLILLLMVIIQSLESDWIMYKDAFITKQKILEENENTNIQKILKEN